MDKKDMEKAVKLIDTIVSWKVVMKEARDYIDQDVDNFTVSSGPWMIVYDSTKESEVAK